MKTMHLGLLTGFVALAVLLGSAPSKALASCDSCVSHSLPTQTTAFYGGPVAATTYYRAPRFSWWRRWRRTPVTAFYPTTARVANSAGAFSADGCSTCTPQVSYMPQTSYRVQVVNRPVTTMQPTTIVDNCTGCVRTVMRPVTTYVPQYQYVPTTVYRPVCNTGCATACVSCAGDGCATCAPAGPATITTPQATEQPSLPGPTQAAPQPEQRLKPIPDKETDDASDKTKKATGDQFPRLNDPNDRTASRTNLNVRRVAWEQATPNKKPTRRQVEEGGWYSAK